MNFKKLLYLTFTAAAVAACSEYPVPENVAPEIQYPEPDDVTPVYALEDSIAAGWEVKTIEEFQAMNTTELPVQITEKYLMKGIIVGDDESGNLYKKVYIQDSTAGIELALDQVNLYNIMPRGQEVIIEMQDMWIGKYRDAYQIGDTITHPKYGFQMSRYDWAREYTDKHFYNNGRPNLEKMPKPLEILSAGAILSSYYGTLVTLKNVTFPDANKGKLITWSQKEQNVNRTVQFFDDTEIIVRTSGYCNFYADFIPSGRGDITGIVTTYGGTVQLYLRDREDVGIFIEE